MKLIKIFLIISALVISNQASAEIHQCDGVWTNKACGEVVETKLEENKSPDKKATRLMSEKRFFLHELTTKNIEARKKYGIKIDISSVNKLCLDPASPLEKCKELIEGMDEKLEQRMSQAKLIQAQKDANRIQEERNKIEAKNKNTTIIAVVQPVITPTLPPPNYSESEISITGDATGVKVRGSVKHQTRSDYPFVKQKNKTQLKDKRDK